MQDAKEKNIAPAGESRRSYKQPVLSSFGSFTQLTMNGGKVQSPDAQGKSTKSGP